MKKTLLAIICIGTFFIVPSASAIHQDNTESIKVRIEQIKNIECVEGMEKYVSECLSATVKVTEGSIRDKIFELDISQQQITKNYYQEGETYYATYFPDNNENPLFLGERYRLDILIALAIIFALIVIAYGKLQGLSSLIALLATFAILIGLIANGILAGWNPTYLAFFGGALILFFGLFFAHGFNKKSLAAFIGSIISLVITMILTAAVLKWTQLTGLTSDEVFFLQSGSIQINLLDVLYVGIIIGTLGVLDDITIGQSSMTFEIVKANPDLPGKEVYKRVITTGKDHIAAMVNTLIIAYAGASFPLFLLIYKEGAADLGVILNSEKMAAEIIRMLLGSIGLILAVPLTSWIAGYMAAKK